jgi:hypothetical protein
MAKYNQLTEFERERISKMFAGRRQPNLVVARG